MNIKELKEIISNLPDDMPVLEGPNKTLASECWAEVVNLGEDDEFLWIAH